MNADLTSACTDVHRAHLLIIYYIITCCIILFLSEVFTLINYSSFKLPIGVCLFVSVLALSGFTFPSPNVSWDRGRPHPFQSIQDLLRQSGMSVCVIVLQEPN